MAVTCQKTPLFLHFHALCRANSYFIWAAYFVWGGGCVGFPVYSGLRWWELCGRVNIVPIKFEEWPLTTRSFCRKVAGLEAFKRKNFTRLWFVFNSLKCDTHYLHHLECLSSFFVKEMTFSPGAKLRIPLSLVNCYSLCLSQTGMCFGKFSTPPRPSRKKEAFWLLQQKASSHPLG